MAVNVNVKVYCPDTEIVHGFIYECQTKRTLPSIACHYMCYYHYESDSLLKLVNCNKNTGKWNSDLNQLCKVATPIPTPIPTPKPEVWTPTPSSSHVASGSNSVYIGVGLASFVVFAVALISCYIGRKHRQTLRSEQSERIRSTSSPRQREVAPTATRYGRTFVIRSVRQILLFQRTPYRELAQPISPPSYQETPPSYETVVNNTSPVESPNGIPSSYQETNAQGVNNGLGTSGTQFPVHFCHDPPPPYELTDN